MLCIQLLRSVCTSGGAYKIVIVIVVVVIVVKRSNDTQHHIPKYVIFVYDEKHILAETGRFVLQVWSYLYLYTFTFRALTSNRIVVPRKWNQQ